MNINSLLSQRSKALSTQINLEADSDFPQLDPSVTSEQAVETSNELETQLEDSLGKIDVVLESAEVVIEAEGIHNQQLEEDLVEDPVVTDALNAALDAASNDVVENVDGSDYQGEIVSLEAENVPSGNAPEQTKTEAAAGGGFKERLQKWKKAIVDFIIKIKDWFLNLLTNYEKIAEELKAKSAALVAHFTGGQPFKFKVKTASVVGDNNIGSINDITQTFKNSVDELGKLTAKTGLAKDPSFAEMNVSFPVFGGTAVLSAGDFKVNNSSAQNKEVELDMTSSTANQLKTVCDSLANILAGASKAKREMTEAARAAENELRSAGGEGDNKDNIKRIRNTVVFINNVYKAAGKQAKVILSEVLPVRAAKENK